MLTAIAFNKTGDREIAEELVQDTFINLYHSKSLLKTDTSIKAYLYVILKNKIIDYFRRVAVHQRYADYIVQHTPLENSTPLAYVETRELERILKDAIDRLPPQCQMVFKLSREEQLSDKEIAGQMDISVNTVEQHKRKALRLLRNSLGGFMGLSAILYLFGK